ncbi:MAG: 30S ribosomal protein S2 [Bacteroidota bacterium]
MAKPTYKELLDAGAHFGHLKKKWNPKMTPYIFMERKGIHIIDLNRTIESMERAAKAMKQIARSGKKIMFVATKKQARHIVAEAAREVGMPYVTERWLGGMMTNFSTIRRSVKKMNNIDKILADEAATSITKKERLTLTRERNKLEKVLGGIANLNRLPAAIFIVDIHHEHIAIAEAHKLGMRTFGIVDTNSDPNQVDFAIPANDDASRSIELVVKYMTEAIQEGLDERRKNKDPRGGSGKKEQKAAPAAAQEQAPQAEAPATTEAAPSTETAADTETKTAE